MEDHFHAAVLLGFEGLIEIGAVREIRAAVGDEEGGVDAMHYARPSDENFIGHPATSRTIADSRDVAAAFGKLHKDAFKAIASLMVDSCWE